MAKEEKKPWYKRPLVLVGIGSGAIVLVTGGIILYKHVKNNAAERTGKSGSMDDFDDAASRQAPELPTPSYAVPTTATNSVFPLKKGSRGEMVKNLQNAIILKYGASALPKYGADGDWGSETQKFFDSRPELKSVIDNTTYTDYITGNFSGSKSANDQQPKTTTSSSGFITDLIKSTIPSSITNPYIKVGWQLFDAAKKKAFAAAITLLKNLNNVNDYSSASEGFQMRPYELPLRRYTLVTGLLDAFKDSAENKKQIREQFRRIGLKETVKNSDPANYDSSWALSGPGSDLRKIYTKMKAIITDGFNIRMEIPAHTLVGRWLSSGNGYTRFRSFDGRTMYVRTNAIQLK